MPSTFAALAPRLAEAEAFGYGLGIESGARPGPAWTRLDRLSTAAEIERSLDALRTVVGAPSPRGLPVAWYVEKVAWHVGSPLAAALVCAGTLPRLRPSATWLRFTPYGLAIGASAADDTACAPGGEHELAALFSTLMAPLVEAAGRYGRATRTLWRHAGDRLADAFLWSGEAFGCRERAWRLAEDVLALETPFSVPPRFALEDDSATRVRRTCCLAFRLADTEPCGRCPVACEGSRRVAAASANR
jgi:hypothetical protein